MITNFNNFEIILENKFNTNRRKTDAEKGYALPNGSFPIENEKDLKDAIKALPLTAHRIRAKRHIIKRAEELNATNLLPKSWLK